MIYQQGVSVNEPFILLENKLTALGTMSSTGAMAGTFADNVLSPTTFDVWASNGGTATWLVKTVTAEKRISFDTFAIARHNLGSLRAQLRFGWMANGASAVTYSAPMFPNDDGPIVLMLDILKAFDLFYLRVDLPKGDPAIGTWWAGDRVLLPSFVQPEYVRAPDARRIDGEAAISRGGQYLGATIRRRGGSLSPHFSPVSRQWADMNIPQIREVYDKRRPFFFGSAPSAIPDDVAYCWRAEDAGELRASLVAGGEYVRFGMELETHA